MNKKKILNFIEELKTMANNLDDQETAAELTGESSMPSEPASVQTTVAATYDPVNEIHTYKSVSLPDNITVQVDVSAKSVKTVFDLFEGIKTFSGLKPVLIYNFNTANTCFGQGFSMNIIEKLEEVASNSNGILYCEYVDALGDRYVLCDEVVSGMCVTSALPKLAENSKKVSDFFTEFQWEYWLIRGATAKAFDKNGRLVYVLEASGNYAQIHYNSAGKIVKIVDGNENIRYGVNEYTFEYDSSGYLSKITEMRNGRSVTFSCSNGRLRAITYSDGKTLSFSYPTYTLTVDSTDCYTHTIQINYSNVSITSQSTVDEVPAGGQVTGLPNIVDYKISLDTTVQIKDTDGNSEYYKYSSDGKIVEYFKEVNAVVTYAERSEYRSTKGSRVYSVDTYIAPNNILNKTPYANFTFTKVNRNERMSTTYDKYNFPVLETHYYKPLSTDYYMNTTKVLTYSDEGLLTKEDISYCQYLVDEDVGETDHIYYTEIVDYEYDDEFCLKKRSSYFKGKETIDGKSVEEYGRYVEGGYHKETVISYNSLEPTNAFVSETTYDMQGNLLKQTDSTGLKYNFNLWGSNFDELYEIVFPNDSRLHYNYENGKVVGAWRLNPNSTNKITYSSGEVTGLSCNQSSMSFIYDEQRRLSKVKMDGNNYYSLSYSGDTADPVWVKITNAKGESYTCEEDKAHTYSKVSYGNTPELQTNYNKSGQITTENDNLSNEKVEYTYTDLGQLWVYVVKEDNSETYRAYIMDNEDGRLFSIRQSGVTDIVYGFSYESGLNGRLDRIVAGKDAIYINYDKLGRYTGRTVNYEGNKILDESIEYKQVNEDVKLGSETRNLNRQSNLPSQISYSEGDKDYIEYDYDASGNITEINKNGKLIKYTYDSADRLVREDNEELDTSYFYTYDNNGNITKKEKCDATGTSTVINYSYNGNKLTSFGSESCTYDSIGNPTTYRGKSATWKGRQLQSFNGVSFKYDGRGRRIKKGTVRYYYDYEDKLVSGNGLDYFYDHIGVAGFRYGGKYYTYKRDIQNNVIAILDSDGTCIVEYKYDAWGNHTVSGEKATTIGAINPFRYRSYFYDIETGLYYLQTRYYDPEVGRFLNMDNVSYADPEATDGLNLYVYCGNNPVMNIDPTGHIFFTCLLVGLIAGAAIGATVNGVNAYNDGARGWDLAGAIASGALIGGAIGAAAGAVVGAGAALFAAGLPLIKAGMSGGMMLVGGSVLSGGALVAVGAGAAVTGGALAISGVLGGIYMFAKGSGRRFGHNQHENQMWDEAMRQLDIEDKDLRRRLHQKNRKMPYAETLKDLLKNIREILSNLGL